MSEYTFAREVRDALCESGLQIKKKCCRRALYYGSLIYRRSGRQQTEAYVKLFEKLSGEGYGLPNASEVECPKGCENCVRNFLKGVFISCGTVTDPDTSSYQLELRVSDDERADRLEELLDECGFAVKAIMRQGSRVLYFKDSESIEDFLNFIGAQKAAFSLMNAKIIKDIRNNANRLANCDAANIDKTVSAAQLQIKAFEKLMRSSVCDSLSDELRATMQLRLDNPEATLPELARLHNPPITKSGVNHRLKKLMSLSEQLPDDAGIDETVGSHEDDEDDGE